jgi:amidohydrolase
MLTPFHDWLVDLRRHFHRYPELAYHEEKTAAKIVEVLEGLGIAFQSRIARTGIVAMVEAVSPGPTIAMRADMDALPLLELNDVDYKSTVPGRMHACGHDGHVTIALGVARFLVESGWKENGRGRILLIFQPAEEGGAGALAMIESGFMDLQPIEAIFAGHLHPELPTGHIGIAAGVSNASSDAIDIRLRGKGGHGAQPHLCIDPVVAGAHLITQMQHLISRRISPTESAVLTIGSFQAGTARNIIPNEAVMQGTLRTLNESVRDSIMEKLHALVDGLQKAHEITADLEIVRGYPLVVNDLNMVRFVCEESAKFLGENRVHIETPRMGAEDFAYFLQKAPGALIRLGCHDPGQGFTHGLHSPLFNFDERALDVGVGLFARLLTGYAAMIDMA